MIEQLSFKSVFLPEHQRELADEVKSKRLRIGAESVSTRNRFEDMRVLLSLCKRMMDVFMGKKSLSAQDQDLMEVINGEHARVLGNKTQFPHLLRELGYLSPDGIVVSYSDDIAKNREKIASYFGGRNGIRLFAKPVNGTWQRNLIGVESGLTVEEMVSHLASMKEDYLVQEYLPTAKENEWRYIRYKNKDGKVYVACFQYGHDYSVAETRLPIIGKKFVPAHGATLNELATITRQLRPDVMTNENGRLDNLNEFIDQFVRDLEKKLGGEIPFLSMDVGIRDPSIFLSSSDLETLKQNVVFYETQTTPNPWQLKKHNKGEEFSRRTYFDIWRLMIAERGTEMRQRAKHVLARYRVSDK